MYARFISRTALSAAACLGLMAGTSMAASSKGQQSLDARLLENKQVGSAMGGAVAIDLIEAARSGDSAKYDAILASSSDAAPAVAHVAIVDKNGNLVPDATVTYTSSDDSKAIRAAASQGTFDIVNPSLKGSITITHPQLGSYVAAIATFGSDNYLVQLIADGGQRGQTSSQVEIKALPAGSDLLATVASLNAPADRSSNPNPEVGGATCATATSLGSIAAGPVVDSGSTVGGSTVATTTCTTGGNTSAHRWYTFTPTLVGNYTISLCGSTTADTKIQVWRAVNCALLPASPGTCVIGNDDFCGLTSQATVAVTAASVNTLHHVTLYAFSTATTYAYTMTITGPTPPPANDLCANPTAISCGQTLAGTTTGATVDTGFTGCTTTNGSAPGVWYRFQATGSTATASLCGSAYDTKIHIYDDGCANPACLGGNDDFCGLQSQVTVTTTPGAFYRILVHGFGTASGNFTLNVTCAAPTPSSCTNVASFGSATIAPTCAGVAPTPTTISTCSFAGEFSTINGVAGGQSLTFTSAAPADNITVHRDTPNGPVVGFGFSPLTVIVPAGTTVVYPHWNLTTPTCGTDSSCHLTTVQCNNCGAIPAPANDTCAGAVGISSCGSVNGSTGVGTCATLDAGLPSCTTGVGTNGTAPGVWYTFTGAGQSVTLNTCGSAYDTQISVYTGGCGAPQCVIGNDDFCGLQSQVTFVAAAGTVYNVLVHGYLTASGTFTLTSCVNDAPVFAGVPNNQTLECSDPVPAPPIVTATTACGSATVTLTQNTTPGSCPQSSTITRTWTAVNSCGASFTGPTQTITILDRTAPVISGVPADSTVECPDPVPGRPAVTAADNCAPGTATSPFAGGSGNMRAGADVTGTVEPFNPNKLAQDGGRSVDQAPSLINITCQAPGGACGPAGCNTEYTLPVGTTTGTPDTWHYHAASCTPGASVTVRAQRTSHLDPVMTVCSGNFCGQSNTGWTSFACPTGSTLLGRGDDNLSPPPCGGFGQSFGDPQVTFLCPASGVFTAAVYAFSTTSLAGDYNFSGDGCTAPQPACATTLAFNEVTTPGSCVDNYTVVRTWTATDCCANSSVDTQTIVHEDSIAPVLTGGILAPAAADPASSVCSPAVAGAFTVVCSSTQDDCDNAPETTTEIVVTNYDVVNGECVTREEAFSVLCGETIEIALAAAACPASSMAAPTQAQSVNSAGTQIFTGVNVVLYETAADRCNNVGTATYDPSVSGDCPLAGPPATACPVPVCPGLGIAAPVHNTDGTSLLGRGAVAEPTRVNTAPGQRHR